jgi:hypothetical protein
MLPNRENFLVKDPVFHPLSSDYASFWSEQMRRCVLGHWEGGTWMPPSLYYYINFHTIRLNKDEHTATKMFAQPHLRDLEWYFFRHYTEARGFSGFSLDQENSSHRILLDPDISIETLKKKYPNTITPDGRRKNYIPARSYMTSSFDQPMGDPLFENQLQNFMMLGSRDIGKSYSVSGLIAHNFIFSGAVSLDGLYNPEASEILVGAEKSDKSADILKKVRDALDLLPGKQTIYTGTGERTYPSPLNKRYRGSWDVNKEIVAEYKKKSQGAWTSTGSKTSIKHRSFNSDSFAAQGTRPLLMVLEEVGMFSNLKDVYVNSVDALRRGLRKTGMLMMLGTGGDMEKGTLDASEMFYEPDKYDLLPFEDVWEGRGKIAYFVPAYLALDNHKNSNGESDIEAAKNELLKVRKRKQGNNTSSEALNKEMQYRPLVPSEMFLSKSANVFPTAELRRRLSEVQTHKIYDHTEKKVNLFFDPKSKYNGVNYDVDPRLDAISVFPYDGDAREGAVVIYEFPKLIDDKVPDGAYIIGCDPFKDDSQTGQSLASIYVMKTSKYPSTIGYDEIVASYIGRPYLGKNQVNETLHKLSLFYGNAKIYFENAVGNVKDYFEKVRRLDLLARQPVTVFNRKASYDSSPQIVYGYPMSNQKIKWEALQYLRMWLLEEREENKRNLDLIIDPGLLQELISFTMEGNFDRVMSLVGCIIGMEETRNLAKRKLQSEQETSQIQKDFERLIVNNKNLFNAKLSKTTSIIYPKSQEQLQVG